MNAQSYLCKCAIHPDGHSVRKVNKMLHSLEVQQFKASQDASLVQGIEKLSLNNTGNTQVNEDASVATLMTALTLTDDGPLITKQHSKLWSSSSEFHQSFGQNIPVTMGGVPMNDVQSSIQAILSESVHITPPPPRPSPAVPCSATFTRPGASANAWARKAEGVITAVEVEARTIGETLIFDEDKRPSNDMLRMLLANAAKFVDSAGKSLASVKNQTPAVLDHKKKVIAMLRSIDSRISQLGAIVPPPLPEEMPVFIEAGHVYESPVAKLDTIAQMMMLLGAVCHIIVGLSTEPCDFIINVVTMIVKMAMATTLPKCGNSEPEYNTNQRAILEQLPTSLFTALNRFNIDGQTTIYAACPSCNFTHEPVYDRVSANATYPSRCTNRIFGVSNSSVCDADLLEARNGRERPIKPFVVASFPDYLAQSLADPEVERLSKQACDDAMTNMDTPPDETTNIFDAKFMKSFEGPIPGQLFIDRGDKVRIAFAMHVDFFNPNGTKRRGNHDSIGIISLANLNLPETIRYRPEHIFLAGVIPGPKECNLEEINHFIRPIMDQLERGWKCGFHISRTADSPERGEVVEVAVALSVNDLPAARKVSGTAGHGADFICTVCNSYKCCNLYNTDFENWKSRNVDKMREQAKAWRDADSSTARNKIFDEYGVRWSEFWRLPYWDPTRMLVIDSMHCILEGLVHYHCRNVLCIDAVEAKASGPQAPAFLYPWKAYSLNDAPPEFRDFKDVEIKHVADIQKQLCLPFNCGSGTLNEAQLITRLSNKSFRPLKFIFSNLDESNLIKTEQGVFVPARTKVHFATLLVKWRLKMPLNSPDAVPKTCTTETMQYIQDVIKTTSTPSWIHSVPANYGEASAGSIKADEWRILSTVYLPIALVTLWGDQDGASPPEGSHFLKLLDHTMALFQAVTLVVQYTMNTAHAGRYRDFIKVWTDGLHTLHPHTKEHKNRVNVHAAFHIYDFLLLFGPVISWWCFPFERLIGALQKINTNDIIGGPLEHTLLRSHMRAAGLRRWLKRPDCPEVIRRFKGLFDKAFSQSVSADNDTAAETTILTSPREVAHYMYNGVNFSRSSTHLGNSLVLYYPSSLCMTPVAGSIEKIIISSSGVHLSIKRQAQLPPEFYDPFRRYPSFPAKVYSSKMVDGPPDKVSFDSVVSHVARFTFSSNRAVILNLSRV
ncbi:hypothetical protein Hypma_014527 [Hypsizygus marmoreus]|uniref:Uncharacterized protein n=1 Tax=Hypsizygus marmoreus TaxID=39966 RepID=A0A369J9S8_HYPMA|nr:hypothetical protein Hypma_014527 [Hypsizygus marmoreus]